MVGHEYVGVVEEVGSAVKKVKVGDFVVASFVISDVEERGDEGVAKIKALTNGLGAHSVVEAVGIEQSTMQAIRATRPGGHMGFVGVNHGVSIPGPELFFAEIHTHGGPAPVRHE